LFNGFIRQLMIVFAFFVRHFNMSGLLR
jgi:hypothetical protein